MRKLILLTGIFYLLLLAQTSFLVHFGLLTGLANLTVIVLVLVNLLEDQTKKDGLILALPAGLLLDFYSAKPLGFWVLILLAMALAIKLLVKRYVRIPFAPRP